MMRITKYILPVLCIAAFAAGCLRDNTDGCGVDGNGEIIIQFKTPESFANRTRALDDAKEADISTIDILVFEDNGTSETFMYYVEPTHINNNPGSSVKYFTATLKISENGEKQRLVILANAQNRDKLGVVSIGTEKQAALDKILFNSAYEWSGNNLPMWGESDRSVIVTERTNGSAFGSISMLYSMARIDVGLNANQNWTAFRGIEHYSISALYLCNTNKRGYIAPHKADLAAGLPTIPSAAEGNNDISCHQYFCTEGKAPGDQNYLPPTGAMHLIYASEYANIGKAPDEVSYLVLSIRYDDPDDGIPATDSWYRIDFYDRDPALSTIKRLDLLRGHRYMVNITGIDGPGYPNLEDAKNSILTRLNAQVVVWNENGIVTGLEADSYVLNVAQSEFLFDGQQHTNASSDNKVNVFTDYPGGWKITGITDVTGSTEIPNAWLSTNRTSGNYNVTTELSINMGFHNAATPRMGRIYIQAGKWTYIINVVQRQNT